jgi:chromosome segregation ATPase
MKVAAHMRIRVLAILFTGILSGAMLAQDLPQTPQPIPPPPPPPDAATVESVPAPAAATVESVPPATETDRFPALREAADLLRSQYEELDAKNMAEIEKLTRTRRCQMPRIGPLLNRTITAMEEWATAEKKYWTVWGEVEQKRVDSQMKTLASMQAELERVASLEESEKADQQELQRQKAGLEQTKRTEEINAQIDGLIKDIQDSEARLADTQHQFESLTTQITNMRANVSARLVGIRQNLAKVDTSATEARAFYEQKRAAADEICNTKKPDERSTPLPKKPAGG